MTPGVAHHTQYRNGSMSPLLWTGVTVTLRLVLHRMTLSTRITKFSTLVATFATPE